MAIVCSPESLAELSRCFMCLTPGQRDAAKTYALAVLAGVSLEPETLMADAKCFTCLTPHQLKMLQPYLMCLISEASDTPAVPCENIEGAGDPT